MSTLSIHLLDDNAARLKALARSRGQSMNKLIEVKISVHCRVSPFPWTTSRLPSWVPSSHCQSRPAGGVRQGAGVARGLGDFYVNCHEGAPHP